MDPAVRPVTPWTPAELDTISPDFAPSDAELEVVEQHKAIISQALGELERALGRLASELANAPFAVVFEPEYGDPIAAQDPPIVAYRRLDHGPSLAAAVTAYRTLHLAPDDDVNTSPSCCGAIGVDDPRIIAQAHEVNRLKTRLKAVFKPLSNRRILVRVQKRGAPVVTKIPTALYILRQLQASSLSRLSAYRQIPLIRTEGKYAHPPTPLRIHFTEAWSRSLVRRTVAELLAEAGSNKPPRSATIAKLERSGIPETEYLYSPKKAYLRMRANLYFPGTTPAAQAAKHYMAGLPILFLRDKRLGTTEITPPKARQSNRPRPRRGVPLSDDPVITKPSFYRRQDPAQREHGKPRKRS